MWGGKELVCVLMHSGDSGSAVGGGHWVAYGREEGGQWWQLDSATAAAQLQDPFLTQVGSRRNANVVGLMLFK